MTSSLDQPSTVTGVSPWDRTFVETLSGRKGEIIAAAFWCVAEKGLQATSTHEIARRAGLNQGVIHYHFRSRQNLIGQLALRLCGFLSEQLDTQVASDRPTVEKLQRVVELIRPLEGSRTEFVVFVALWAQAMAEGGALVAVIQGAFRRWRTGLEAIVEQGRREGVFISESARFMPLLLVSMYEGLGLQYVIDPQCIPSDEFQEIVAAAFASLLAVTGADPDSCRTRGPAGPQQPAGA